MKERTILLAVLTVFSICLVTQGQPWLGSGTEGEPYLIEDANDMQYIGADPNYWDAHFLLVNDINLAQFTGTEFNIIGNDSNAFTGVFDGNDHTISNFTYEDISGRNYIGLFGIVEGPNAMIKDLTLIDPNVDVWARDMLGSLVGLLGDGIVSRCGIRGGGVLGYLRVGGLVGCCEGGSITDCYAETCVEGINSSAVSIK